MRNNFKRIILYLGFLASAQTVFSQSLEANHWFFGHRAGVKFFPHGPRADTTGNNIRAVGVASISNKKGDLLFYADADSLYDGKGKVVQGEKFSNAQSHIIQKLPNSPNQFILVSGVDYILNGVPREVFMYHLIELTGKDSIRIQNFGVLNDSVLIHGLAILDHSNEQDKWLLFSSDSFNGFVSYLITKSGIDLSSKKISVFGQRIPVISGYNFSSLKSSPNSLLISRAIGWPANSLELFAFNRSNGHVTQKIFGEYYDHIQFKEFLHSCFSPNSKILFAPHRNKLLAYNLRTLDSTSIMNSKVIIDTTANASRLFRDMQIGLDGNIYYIARKTPFPQNKLCRIKCPDQVLTHRMFEDTILGPLNQFGDIGVQLPTLNQTLYVNAHKLQAQSISYSDTLCPGDSAQLVAYGASMDQFVWSPGNGLSCSNCPSPMAAPSVTTTYRVIGRATSCTVDNLDTAFVTVYVVPPANNVGVIGKHTFCLGDSMPLSVNVPFRSILWNTGSTNDTLWASSQGIYSAVLTTACYTKTINHTLVQLPEPTFSVFPKDTTVCEGQQVRFRGLSNATIHWFNGSSGDYTFARQAGTYYEYAENQCGIAIDTAVIRHSIPKASFVLDSAVGFAPFSTQALAPDSFASFLWMLNENEVGNSAQLTLSALAVDTHVLHLMAFDQLGCSDTTSQFIYVRNPVFEKLPSLVDSGNVPCAVLAYPNPFEREFTLSPKNASQPILELFISDAMGKSIFQANELVYGFPLKVAPDHQANGVYFIRYQCNGQWFEHKVVKTD